MRGPRRCGASGPLLCPAGLLCGPTGVPGAGAPWRAGLLGVPVGGGPPASRPRRELRSARRLEARPGPATAHGHRSQALLPLRRPPHQWGLACWRVAGRVGSTPGQALSVRWPGCLKPQSPLLTRIRVGLKPQSPLRVRNRCFCCSFRTQRRCRFQRSLVGGEQWCCWFQRRHVVAPRARHSSPCSAWCGYEREKVRPARSKHPKFGVFTRAGRVFSRKCRRRGRAGRTLSRRGTGGRPLLLAPR